MSKLSSLYKAVTGERLSDALGGGSSKKSINLPAKPGINSTTLLLIGAAAVGVYFIAKRK